VRSATRSPLCGKRCKNERKAIAPLGPHSVIRQIGTNIFIRNRLSEFQKLKQSNAECRRHLRRSFATCVPGPPRCCANGPIPTTISRGRGITLVKLMSLHTATQHVWAQHSPRGVSASTCFWTCGWRAQRGMYSYTGQRVRCIEALPTQCARLPHVSLQHLRSAGRRHGTSSHEDTHTHTHTHTHASARVVARARHARTRCCVPEARAAKWLLIPAIFTGRADTGVGLANARVASAVFLVGCGACSREALPRLRCRKISSSRQQRHGRGSRGVLSELRKDRRREPGAMAPACFVAHQ